MIVGGAAAAVIVAVILFAIISSLRGPVDRPDTRSDTERISAERQGIEREMQLDIDKAKARGASNEDIEKIRKGYTDALKQIGK